MGTFQTVELINLPAKLLTSTVPMHAPTGVCLFHGCVMRFSENTHDAYKHGLQLQT